MRLVPRRARPAVVSVAQRLPPSLTAPLLRRRLPEKPAWRDLTKARWRNYWPQTRALMRLHYAGELAGDAEAEHLALELLDAITLPQPVETYDAVVRRLGVDEVSRGPEELDALAEAYRATARALVEVLRRNGLALEESRVLDVGCGSGVAAFAMDEAGAASVIGIDVTLDAPGAENERDVMRRRFGSTAELRVGDAMSLDFDDGSFDFVYSGSAVEHIADPGAAFRELFRVLRPGGASYHGVDMWLGPAGGHALCTLDTPWGHARIDRDGFADYVTERRPHEAADAIGFYDNGFQKPRLTSRELVAAARAAGFEVVDVTLRELELLSPHRAAYSRSLLRDVRRFFPRAQPEDLLSSYLTLELRRP